MYRRTNSLIAVVIAIGLPGCSVPQPASPPSVSVATNSGRRFTADELIAGYWQDEQRNCTSVAFTKAVLDRFGTASGMFSGHYKSDDRAVSVQTADGVELSVTHAQIDEASVALGIQHVNEPAFKEASVLFALLGAACARDCAGAQQHCNPIRDRGGTSALAIPTHRPCSISTRDSTGTHRRARSGCGTWTFCAHLSLGGGCESPASSDVGAPAWWRHRGIRTSSPTAAMTGTANAFSSIIGGANSGSKRCMRTAWAGVTS
jgi:hypothetical protein